MKNSNCVLQMFIFFIYKAMLSCTNDQYEMNIQTPFIELINVEALQYSENTHKKHTLEANLTDKANCTVFKNFDCQYKDADSTNNMCNPDIDSFIYETELHNTLHNHIISSPDLPAIEDDALKYFCEDVDIHQTQSCLDIQEGSKDALINQYNIVPGPSDYNHSDNNVSQTTYENNLKCDEKDKILFNTKGPDGSYNDLDEFINSILGISQYSDNCEGLITEGSPFNKLAFKKPEKCVSSENSTNLESVTGICLGTEVNADNEKNKEVYTYKASQLSVKNMPIVRKSLLTKRKNENTTLEQRTLIDDAFALTNNNHQYNKKQKTSITPNINNIQESKSYNGPRYEVISKQNILKSLELGKGFAYKNINKAISSQVIEPKKNFDLKGKNETDSNLIETKIDVKLVKLDNLIKICYPAYISSVEQEKCQSSHLSDVEKEKNINNSNFDNIYTFKDKYRSPDAETTKDDLLLDVTKHLTEVKSKFDQAAKYACILPSRVNFKNSSAFSNAFKLSDIKLVDFIYRTNNNIVETTQNNAFNTLNNYIFDIKPNNIALLIYKFYCNANNIGKGNCIVRHDRMKPISLFYELPLFLDLMQNKRYNSKIVDQKRTDEILMSFLNLSKKFYSANNLPTNTINHKHLLSNNFIIHSRIHILLYLQHLYYDTPCYAYYCHGMIDFADDKKTSQTSKCIETLLYAAFFIRSDTYHTNPLVVLKFNTKHRYKYFEKMRSKFRSTVFCRCSYLLEVNDVQKEFLDRFNRYITNCIKNCNIKSNEYSRVYYYLTSVNNICLFKLQRNDSSIEDTSKSRDNLTMFQIKTKFDFFIECLEIYHEIIKHNYYS